MKENERYFSVWLFSLLNPYSRFPEDAYEQNPQHNAFDEKRFTSLEQTVKNLVKEVKFLTTKGVGLTVKNERDLKRTAEHSLVCVYCSGFR